MKIYKSAISVMLSLTMLALAACGGTVPSPAPESAAPAPADQAANPEPAAAPPESVDLLVSRWAGPHADFQKEVVKDYLGGTVTIDDVDYGNLKQKQILSFQSAAGTDGNYDLVWVNSQWMKEYVEAGYLYGINDLLAEAGVDTSIYNKGMMDGCVFDGETYGLPTYAQCLIIAYDAKVFAAEGLNPPTTADELIAVSQHFKEKGSGIALPAKQATAAFTLWSQLLYSDGGDYFDADGKLALTSDLCVQSSALYDELVKYSVDGSLGWAHDETAEAVRTGVAPIGIIMSGLANQNHDPEKSLIVDSVEYCTLNGKSGNTAANNAFWVWAVPKNAANPKASAEFAAWFTSFEVEKRQTMENQQISAIDELSSDPEVLAKAPFLPVVMKEFENGKMDPPLAEISRLKDALAVALSELASTDADPAQVMQKTQEELQDVDFSK